MQERRQAASMDRRYRAISSKLDISEHRASAVDTANTMRAPRVFGSGVGRYRREPPRYKRKGNQELRKLLKER